MPKFEKLSQDKIDQLKQRKTPALDLTDYLSYLTTLSSGDWGSVTPEAGEAQRAIKRRLTIASRQQGKTIKYRRSVDNKIVFEVK